MKWCNYISYIMIGIMVFAGIALLISGNAHATIEGITMAMMSFLAPVIATLMLIFLLVKYRGERASWRSLMLALLAGSAPWITLGLFFLRLLPVV